MRDGRSVKVPRTDLLHVSQADYKTTMVGDSYRYDYTIDTREVYWFGIGVPQDNPMNEGVTQTHPKGWSGGGTAWSVLDGAIKAQDSAFSVTSPWRPGLMPIYFRNDVLKDGPPSGASSVDNIHIAQAWSFVNNSLRKFVIGPAIDPKATKETLDYLVQRWVEEYGFTFLQPLLDGKTLDDVKPAEGIETEVLACLREAYGSLPQSDK
jgi:hypothetical protein